MDDPAKHADQRYSKRNMSAMNLPGHDRRETILIVIAAIYIIILTVLVFWQMFFA